VIASFSAAEAFSTYIGNNYVKIALVVKPGVKFIYVSSIEDDPERSRVYLDPYLSFRVLKNVETNLRGEHFTISVAESIIINNSKPFDKSMTVCSIEYQINDSLEELYRVGSTVIDRHDGDGNVRSYYFDDNSNSIHVIDNYYDSVLWIFSKFNLNKTEGGINQNIPLDKETVREDMFLFYVNGPGFVITEV
jgi:hypothetical protein